MTQPTKDPNVIDMGETGAPAAQPLAVASQPAQQKMQVAPQQPTTPGYLLQIAVQQGADLDKLERLMALQERWEAMEAKRAFVAAMAAFKAEPMTIFKKKQVGYTTKDGDFVGYTHARLADVTDVVVPAMGRHGLSHRWDIRQDAGRVHVACVITHQLGHSERVEMDCPPDTSGKKNPLQQIASATSYLQRYTLLAVTGMATKDMDNDGADAGDGDDDSGADDKGARGGAPKPPPPPPPPPPAVPPTWPDNSFNAQFPRWEKAVQSSLKSVDDILALARSKGALTKEQEASIRGIKPAEQQTAVDPFVADMEAAEREQGEAQ